MDTAKVKVSSEPGNIPPNTTPDFDWARENRDALFEAHGACIALVYEQRVVGTGETISEAVINADKVLPADAEMITPIVFVLEAPNLLSSPYPFVLREVR
jgi:hypothetical protein